MSTCKGKRHQLIAWLEGGLGARAATRLQAHVAGCAACRRTQQQLERVRGMLRELGGQEPPDVNDRHVEAQIRWRLARQPGPPRRWQMRTLPVAATVVAALTIGALTGIVLDRRLRTAVGPREPISAEPPTPIAAAVPPAPVVVQDRPALPTLIRGTPKLGLADGRLLPLGLQRPVLAGERLVTGSDDEISLQWSRATGVRLAPDSELAMSRLSSTEQQLVLRHGRLQAQVAKSVGDRKFSVLAGDVKVQVTGTRFAVTHEGKASYEVSVYEGSVLVQRNQQPWLAAQLPPGYPGRIADDEIEVLQGHRLRIDGPGSVEVDAISSPEPAGPVLLPWEGFAQAIASSGSLVVETKPVGADVRFDTVDVGKTDLMIRGAAGRHLVELWRDGKLLRRHWLTVTAAELEQLRVDLRRRAARTPRLPAEIYDIFRQRAPAIRSCYERRLKRNPDLTGRFVLRVPIDKEGSVGEATIESDTLPDPAVAQCALTAVRRWRFPPGAAAEVVYPFIFQPN